MAGRIGVAAIFLSFLVASLLVPELSWAMVAFIAFASAMCVQELRRMFRSRGVRIRKRIAILGVVALVIEGAMAKLDYSILLLGVISCGAFAYRLRSDVEGAFRDVTATIGVVVYVGVPAAVWALIFVTRGEAHVWGALALAMVFLTDSFALFVGKALGRHKLIPNVSPGKTIEGSFGGLLGALIGAAVAWYVFRERFSHTPPWEFALFALVFCLVTQIGDLAESLIKRDAGVKDSAVATENAKLGKVLALGGHGGFLDMLDAVLFTGIPLAVYLEILHPDVLPI